MADSVTPGPQDSTDVFVDPYKLRPEDVQEPPKGWWPTIRQLGPGLILTGSIVGSGELVATTTLGAQVGFVVLWMILLSCAIKVPVQSELARYTIATGKTTFEAFDTVPGPRFRVSWLVWFSLFLLLWSTIQVAGIVGGIGLSLELLIPQVAGESWSVVITIVGMVMVLVGHYAAVERMSILMVAIFTCTTLASAVLLFWTPYAATPDQLLNGLLLFLPSDGAVTAFSVFGITGVGATELMLYSYWCIEKGYARAAGANDGSPEWMARARGWVGVMQKDVLLSMVTYTIATVAFFFLGAAVLHAQGLVPEGFDMVKTLSSMYTETLGAWAFYLFGIGAFAVLFSTYFVSVAGISRMLADSMGVIGLVDFSTPSERQRVVRIVSLLLPIFYLLLYFVFTAPVAMVIIGGLMQTVLLPAIAWAAFYYSRTTAREVGLNPSPWIIGLLGVGTVIMAAFALYAFYARFS